jgi:glycosyltransferase involved in cell wall biosynthesis
MRKKPASGILIVANATNGGGAEKASMEIFQYLASREIEIYFCALNRASILTFQAHADRIYELNRYWKSGLLSTLSNYLSFNLLVKNLNPQAIVVNCELPELFVACSLRKRIRLIAVEHTSRPWFGRKALGWVVRRILQAKNCEWVTVSGRDLNIWPTLTKAIHIPNPVRPSMTSKYLSTHEDAFSAEKSIAYVGRLRIEKRPDWALSAAIKANLGINIFGDGPELERLHQMAASNSENVFFHGFVENPWAEMNPNSLIIVPSQFEGDGLVIVEAILNNHQLLLADNEDLRNFNLPETHYFRSQVELENKVEKWSQDNELSFEVGFEIVEEFSFSRNIKKIGQDWFNLLSVKSSSNKKNGTVDEV